MVPGVSPTILIHAHLTLVPALGFRPRDVARALATAPRRHACLLQGSPRIVDVRLTVSAERVLDVLVADRFDDERIGELAARMVTSVPSPLRTNRPAFREVAHQSHSLESVSRHEAAAQRDADILHVDGFRLRVFVLTPCEDGTGSASSR
jgi:hypothetical protein